MSQDKIQITQILPEMNMRRQAAQVFYQAFARKIHNLEFFPLNLDFSPLSRGRSKG
jgi:hypothetical protein